jgi:hypothetical protein
MDTPATAEEADRQQENITKIAKALTVRFGRIPTEDEVMGFIMGDEAERTNIWNFGLPFNTVKEND